MVAGKRRWIGLTAAVLLAAPGGPARAVTLRGAAIDAQGTLTLFYDKAISGCVRLHEASGRLVQTSEPFCESGVAVQVSRPIGEFRLIDNDVMLCDEGAVTCSPPRKIGAPAHPLVFHLGCALAEELAAEIAEPFDCASPSAAVLDELATRLLLYMKDLNGIFAKQTLREFRFDPATGIVLTNENPFSGTSGLGTWDPYDHPLWIWARLTDRPDRGTYGGFLGLDESGAAGAEGLYWDRIHDPATLADGSELLGQYWTQIDHIAHEFEHVFGAGVSEYYNLAFVDDTTGIAPVVHIDKFDLDPAGYWGQRLDHLADPLLHNLFNYNEGTGGSTAYADLIAQVRLADRTAAVLNQPLREDLGASIPDLSQTRVRVLDALTDLPIPDALVDVWNVRSFAPYETAPLLIDAVTDGSGEAVFDFDCVHCFGNFDHLKLVKDVAAGYAPGTTWFSVFDAQEQWLIEGEPHARVVLRLTPVVGGDADQDGTLDELDNCAIVPNDQTNGDADPYGNACDCDFDGDGFCNVDDFSAFVPSFQAGSEQGGMVTDMTGDGFVNIDDFVLFLPGFRRGRPGPAATTSPSTGCGLGPEVGILLLVAAGLRRYARRPAARRGIRPPRG